MSQTCLQLGWCYLTRFWPIKWWGKSCTPLPDLSIKHSGWSSLFSLFTWWLIDDQEEEPTEALRDRIWQWRESLSHCLGEWPRRKAAQSVLGREVRKINFLTRWEFFYNVYVYQITTMYTINILQFLLVSYTSIKQKQNKTKQNFIFKLLRLEGIHINSC